MKLALADAGRAPEEVDYVNLHGTSTVLNDRIETRALKLALGDASTRPPPSGRAPEGVGPVPLHGPSTVLNDRIETRALKLALGDASKRIPMSGTKSQIG